MTAHLSDTIEPIREATQIKVEDVLKDARTVMNNGESPVEFRPFTEGYKLVTESPVIKSLIAAPTSTKIAGLETIESIYNSLRKGTENDIDMQEKFPHLYALNSFIKSSVGPTPENQTYISLVDEINRAQETGGTRLGYNIVDIAAMTADWAFNTEATEKVKKAYEKTIEEGRFAEPETFLGDVGAIGVEFGVPGGSIFKGVNFLRRLLNTQTKKIGVSMFALPTYSLTGGAYVSQKISNVAKRVGTTATVFGATDFVAGGPIQYCV